MVMQHLFPVKGTGAARAAKSRGRGQPTSVNAETDQVQQMMRNQRHCGCALDEEREFLTGLLCLLKN